MPATTTPGTASPAPELRRGARWPTAAVVAVYALQWVAWTLLYRWLLFTGDDFLHTGGPRRLHGRMTAGELLQSYVRDYTEINGRGADTVARIVMQFGATGWQVVGPVVITLISVCAYGLILTGRARPPVQVRIWLALVTSGVPFMLLALRPALAGQVYYWISAAVGYLVGVLLLLAAGSFYLLVRRGCLGVPALVGYAVLMVITHLFHETASVGLLMMGVAFWLRHPRREVQRGAVWVSLASLAGFLANFLSPGSFSRLFMATAPAGPDALSLVERIVRGATMLHTLTWPAVLAIAAAAALMAARHPSVLGASLAVVGAATGLLGAMRALRGADVRVLDGAEVVLPWIFALFLVLAVAVAFDRRGTVSYGSLHLLAGTAGCGAIPVVMGTFERGHLPAALLAWFAAASFLVDAAPAGLTTPGRPSAARASHAVLGAVLVAFLVVVPATAVHTYRATQANHGMWRKTERQIDAAAQGLRATVEFPNTRIMPYPDHVYSNAYLLRRYEPMIRSYYGIDDDVKIVIRKR